MASANTIKRVRAEAWEYFFAANWEDLEDTMERLRGLSYITYESVKREMEQEIIDARLMDDLGDIDPYA